MIEKMNDVLYRVVDLSNKEKQVTHITRMHRFWPGNLSEEQLKAEAAHVDEYFVEKVNRHKVVDKTLWFHVKWLGYPEGDEDNDDSWVKYEDSRWVPEIKDYMQKHQLKPPKKNGRGK